MKISYEHERWLDLNGFNIITVFRHELIAQTVMGETYRFTAAEIQRRIDAEEKTR